ncbi:MAG: hypothetical protein HRU29_12225 [Rhizobiales bacterium]|nr:mitofilin family membrane protein [Hyphomicrobiales bacterium]NRB15155.1 hypothetical protein [Hyphomicrobiales bacterium]
MSDDKMSDDKKLNDKNSNISDDVETIEVIEVEEVVVGADAQESADEQESIEALDAQLDDLLPPIVSKSNPLGSLIIAAVFGGIASIAILFGLGYYLVTSSSLGGLNQLLNGADDTNVLEERYTNISTRILALEGEMSLAQTEIDNLAEQDGRQRLAADENMNSQSTELATIAAIIDELKAKLANAETQASAPIRLAETGGSTDVAALLASQTNVDGQQDAVVAEIKLQISILDEKLISLQQDIEDNAKNAERISKTTVVQGAGNMASALAVAALERALQDEKPFVAELDILLALAGENAALTQLQAFAASGIASEINLYGQFDDLLEAALIADLKGEGKSVLDKFIGNAKSIISIRRTGNVEGDDAEAVLARMEVAVLAKDLPTALAQSQGLAGPAQQVFAPWVASVKTRLLAKQLMRQVSGDILKSLQIAN